MAKEPFTDKLLLIVDTFLEMVVKFVSSPMTIITTILVAVLAWDIITSGDVGAINFIVEKIIALIKGISVHAIKGGWPLFGSLLIGLLAFVVWRKK